MRGSRGLKRLVGAAAITVVLGALAACSGEPGAGPAAADATATAPTVTAGPGSAGQTRAPDARTRAAFPALSPAERIRLYAQVRLQSMTLEQKIASMIMVHVPGADPAPLAAYLDANRPGGLLLLGDNVPGDSGQAAALTGALPVDTGLGTLVAIDEEGGIVARLSADTYPAADTLKDAPVEDTTAAFDQRAALLEQTGMTVNFGIVADVTDDPSSFIFERALGTTPQSSSERVAAAVAAEQGRVFSTLKHFPGHGAAGGDSHTSIPTTALPLEQWRTDDAPPFQAGIDAGAELVMFGHLVYSAVDPAPASLSPEWHRILRDELGFEGVAVTDDLLMLEHSGVPAYADRTANAIAAVGAGNDLLLYNTTVDLPGLVASIAWAARTGALDPALIDDAALRVLELRRELWLATGGRA
ncbi:glycoside hydrolase family 3 protein [Herbiconiux moechotypicola]|uniref:beta-N-acetylhexosaminidase n=1 Tax=Herbiconiux moechotypicola TaxID=637393 RepID=A0ABN3DIA8_9MICO|nr:glycoside hydrolase family 3 N-terminal domain-containing protein [Herbiconiux moechotypicola]MCS5729712.1 glycoside hydrolase family 3 protein [Herbiconiux moechotypicola]